MENDNRWYAVAVALWVLFLLSIVSLLALAVSEAADHYDTKAKLQRAALVGACRAACPEEAVAVQIQELDQRVWFKCLCVLPDRIMERNVVHPKLPAEKAPSK